MSEVNLRLIRGQQIQSQPNQIRQIDTNSFRVHSQTSNSEYVVTNGEEWDCTCPDHVYRGEKCKHIWAVELRLKLRQQVRVIEPLDISTCIYCQSPNIKKYGVRRNKCGDIQRFLCESCRRTFSVNIGFEKMKHNPQAITTALQLYFSGESLRNTQRSLQLLGVKVCHRTVFNWIQKYVNIMNRYVEQLRPNVGDTWRTDEVWLKIKGDQKYLFALMDDETRYLIAQEVAESKYKHDAQSLFRKGKELMGKKPETLISDGLRAYHDAYKKEFWTQKNPRTEHINAIKTSGDMNNNKMERLNGEIRSREKVMRGLKKIDTPILTGYQIFHNYVRPHEALDGRTPADLCGIEVKGRNKWMTLIQNASQS